MYWILVFYSLNVVRLLHILQILCKVWLCDWYFVGYSISREMISKFSLIKCVGLLKIFTLGFYHYFSLLRILKGDNWHVFWVGKNFSVGFLADTVQGRSFKLFVITSVLRIWQFISGLIMLTLFQGQRHQIVFMATGLLES